ncbi:U3 small nucleolar ribonucleoprotein imp3, partial [Dispira simplex]
MVRQFKHHEQKLLRKVDFLHYKNDNNVHEIAVVSRYGLKNREEYHKYNQLVGDIQAAVHALSRLDPTDSVRQKEEARLLQKVHHIGLVPTTSSISQLLNLNVTRFCLRRLPVVMCRLRMAERISLATQYIQQGHIRVGPEIVTDPAFLVTRSMEDFITWVDTSKIRRHVLKYNDR